MKKIFLIIIVLVSHFISGNAQNNIEKDHFILNGKIDGELTDSLVFYYENIHGMHVLNSKVLNKNGYFTFEGQIIGSQPQMVMIMLKEKGDKAIMGSNPNRINFLLEADQMTFTATVGAFDKAVIKGSKSQTEMDELKRLKEKIRKESGVRNKEKESEIDFAFFEEHPDSYVTALHLLSYLSKLSPERLNYYYARLSKKVKQSSFGKRLDIGIKKLQAGVPGGTAADFSATDLHGNSISLSDFEGKYILLDFWATWCIPCRKSAPHLLETYNKYHGNGLEIICIGDNDRQPDQWIAAIKKDGTGAMHHVLRGADINKELKGEFNDKDISGKYGIKGLPTKILIDPNGKIIGRYGSDGEDDNNLDEILAKIFK